MAGFDDPAFYGACWAEIYDDWLGRDPAAAVDFLAALARGGPALELAVGTGRVALPLAARGIAVQGIDASQAMVDRLRAKPGCDAVEVTIGDMAEVPVTGPFRLVYLVFNTLFALLSQKRQADCFRNVARVLEPGGAFVIECFVPDKTRFYRGESVRSLEVTEDSAAIEVSVHDTVQQRVTTQVITIDQRGTHMMPVALRYAWPAELDLMAAQAGLQLRERYAGWDRQQFDSASAEHVSVYERRQSQAPHSIHPPGHDT